MNLCCFVGREHSSKLQSVLTVMRKDTVSDLYKLSDSNYEETMNQVKKESEEEVARAISAIKLMWTFVSDTLESLAKSVDHLLTSKEFLFEATLCVFHYVFQSR
jgi:leucyl aminopeptidase (aminopeptidase T)